MSSTSPIQDPPRVPWIYLGGLLLVFIGFMISVMGGFFFNGGPNKLPPHDKLPYLAVIGLGVAVFAFGSYVLARLEQVRSSDLSLIIVAFIMVPIPALVSYSIHFLGNYLRRTASATVQVILVGVGVFLLTLAVNWAWTLHEGGVARVDFQAFAWPICADLGVVCLLLAALPMFEKNESVPAASAVEPEKAS
jgi:drug/metabolite transporter (DMT)-like permease